jgi:uncharacterized membrane protein YvbJ
MALINCPECNHQVATSAAACPQCGAPIAGAKEAKASGAQLTTVQETSKRFKGQALIAMSMMGVGTVWAVSALQTMGDTTTPGILLGAGLLWYLVNRFRAWWHHG